MTTRPSRPTPVRDRDHGPRLHPGFVQIVFDFDGTPEQFLPPATANANGRFDTTINPNHHGDRAPYRIAAQQADANALLDQASRNSACRAHRRAESLGRQTASRRDLWSRSMARFPAGKHDRPDWSYGIGTANRSRSPTVRTVVRPTGPDLRPRLAGERAITAGMPTIRTRSRARRRRCSCERARDRRPPKHLRRRSVRSTADHPAPLGQSA